MKFYTTLIKKCTVVAFSYLKLEITYGLKGIALDIMKSYLTNLFRQQYTKIGNKHQKKQNNNCSVPQRSSLCYLIYLLTNYFQLHFFLRDIMRTTLFCLWLTKN